MRDPTPIAALLEQVDEEGLDAAHEASQGVWRDLLETRRDLLGRGDAAWPASRILVQLAAEQAPGHPARAAVESWLDGPGSDLVWLRGPSAAAAAEPASVERGPVHFEGHLEGPKEALLLPCDNVVSRSEHELLVWEGRTGQQLAACKGQAEPLEGLLELPDDRFLAISKERAVPVWEGRTGTQVGTLSGQIFGGGLVDRAGRLVTWGLAVHVWDLTSYELLGVIGGGGLGHNLWIRDACLLADGRLLTWSRDKLLAVWDLDELALDCVLKGHRDEVTAARSLPDERVASLSEDKTLRLWDVSPNPRRRGKPRKAVAALKTGQKYGKGLWPLPNDRLMAWFHGGAVQIWKVADQARTAELNDTHVQGAFRLADGRLATWGKGLIVWDIDDTEGDLPGHVRLGDDFLSGAFQLEDGRLVSYRYGGVTVWNSASLEPIALPKLYFNSALPAPGGRLLVWDEFEHSLTLRPLETEAGPSSPAPSEPSAEPSEDEPPVRGIAYVDADRYLTWGDGGALTVRDAESGARLAVWEGHTDRVMGVRRLRSGGVLSWAKDTQLRVWEPVEGRCAAVLEGLGAEPAGVIELPEGHVLAWARGSTEVRVWNLADATLVDRVRVHQKTLHGVALLPNQRLITWGVDRELDDVVTFRSLKKGLRVLVRVEAPLHCRGRSLLLPHRDLLSAKRSEIKGLWGDPSPERGGALDGAGALWLPDGRAVIWGNEPAVRLWDPTTCEADPGRSRAGAPPPIEPAGGLALDGNRWLAWDQQGALQLWEGATAMQMLEGSPARVSRALRLDGGAVALARNTDGSDGVGAIELWDIESGARTATLELDGTPGGLMALAGDRVASWARGSKRVRVWSAAGEHLGDLDEHYEAVVGVCRLTDGRTVSFGREGILRCWSTDLALEHSLDPPIQRPAGARQVDHDRVLLWQGSSYHPQTAFLDLHSWSEVGRGLAGPLGRIEDVRVLPDGRLLAFGNSQGMLWLFRSDGALSAVLQGTESTVTEVAVGPELLSWGHGPGLQRWLLPEDGRAVEVLAGTSFDPALAPRWGRRQGDVRAQSQKGRVELRRERESGDVLVAAWHAPWVFAAALFPGGTVAVRLNGQRHALLRLHRGSRPIPLQET